MKKIVIEETDTKIGDKSICMEAYDKINLLSSENDYLGCQGNEIEPNIYIFLMLCLKIMRRETKSSTNY